MPEELLSFPSSENYQQSGLSPSRGSLSASQAPAQQPAAPQAGHKLNVADALSYLDLVKAQFVDRPHVYQSFLDVMKKFKENIIDTPGVITRVSRMFAGHPQLIQGFNVFLPAGYNMAVALDSSGSHITLTTPTETRTEHFDVPAVGVATTDAAGLVRDPLAANLANMQLNSNSQ